MTKNNESGHRFVGKAELMVEDAERGSIEWLSRAEVTDAQQLMIARVVMEPGQGHSFHYHPRREEAIYVLDGQLEQWVEGEKRILGPGEVAHIPTEVVHATFTLPDTTVTFLAVLSPAQFGGDEVEFMVDVSDREPWAGYLAKRDGNGT